MMTRDFLLPACSSIDSTWTPSCSPEKSLLFIPGVRMGSSLQGKNSHLSPVGPASSQPPPPRWQICEHTKSLITFQTKVSSRAQIPRQHSCPKWNYSSGSVSFSFSHCLIIAAVSISYCSPFCLWNGPSLAPGWRPRILCTALCITFYSNCAGTTYTWLRSSRSASRLASFLHLLPRTQCRCSEWQLHEMPAATWGRLLITLNSVTLLLTILFNSERVWNNLQRTAAT